MTCSCRQLPALGLPSAFSKTFRLTLAQTCTPGLLSKESTSRARPEVWMCSALTSALSQAWDIPSCGPTAQERAP